MNQTESEGVIHQRIGGIYNNPGVLRRFNNYYDRTSSYDPPFERTYRTRLSRGGASYMEYGPNAVNFTIQSGTSLTLNPNNINLNTRGTNSLTIDSQGNVAISKGNLTVNRNATISRDLTVTLSTVLQGNLTVSGSTSAQAIGATSLSVGNDIICSGNITCYGDINCLGTVTASYYSTYATSAQFATTAGSATPSVLPGVEAQAAAGQMRFRTNVMRGTVNYSAVVEVYTGSEWALVWGQEQVSNDA